MSSCIFFVINCTVIYENINLLIKTALPQKETKPVSEEVPNQQAPVVQNNAVSTPAAAVPSESGLFCIHFLMLNTKTEFLSFQKV